MTALFDYGILPVIIFVARMSDVSLATIRFLFISRGQRFAAPLVGFFEVIIWLIAITRILKDVNNPLYYLAYAGGFATGTFVGIWVEEKLALGTVLIRVITRRQAGKLIEQLKDKGFGLTAVRGRGAVGPVYVIFTLVRRRNAAAVIRLIREYDPNTFYTVENVRSARDPIPPRIDRPALFDVRRMGFYKR